MIGFEVESIGYEEFIEKVKKGVQKKVGENCKVSVRPVNKLNGTILYGLNIERQGSNVIPTIYLEHFYEEYMQGRPLAYIVDRIITTDESAKYPEHFDISFFEKYENIKNRLAIKLINAETNQELLEDLPHRNILDLAVIAYVSVCEDGFCEGGITIHNNHIMMWGKSADELLDDAIENAIKMCPAECMGMADLLFKLGEECGIRNDDDFEREVRKTNSSMLVLTNKKRVNGASVIVYKDLLEGLAKTLQSDYLILPSSIHEVIVVPYDREIDIKMINPTIKSINETQVPTGEVLSDHAYLYNRNEAKLISMIG